MSDYLEETRKTYNEQADAFEQTRKPFAQTDSLKKFVNRLDEKKVLEIGCGPGRDARILVDLGCTVTGIDFSKAFIKKATAVVPEATFLEMDMRELAFPKESFDGVWASASLLHMQKTDIASVISNIYSVLKPGGIFYMSLKEGTGSLDEPDDRLDGAKRFFHFYTKEDVEAYLSDAGFSILEVYVEKSDNIKRNLTWIKSFAQK